MSDTSVNAIPVRFRSAQAVWPGGRRTVMNDFVGFRATVRIPEAAQSVILRLAASTVYRPFQPEVMDVEALMRKYRGRLTFIGGLSTQKTLPYGTVKDVVCETRKLLEMGRAGGYVFCPAHAVKGDVPVENMLAFIEEVQKQPGYEEIRS